jgi:hypothetical protein
VGRAVLSLLGAADILDDPARSALKRPVFELTG